jgi:hypothetical protein
VQRPAAAASDADLTPPARHAECDLDGNKRLEAKELHVALLILYAKINEKLPEGVRIPIPTHAQVKTILATADVDKDGHLSRDEFVAVAKVALGVSDSRSLVRSISLQVASRAAVKMIVIPVVLFLLREKIPGVRRVAKRLPDPILAIGIDHVSKLGRAAAMTMGRK